MAIHQTKPTLDSATLLHGAYREALPELLRLVALNPEALKAKLFDLLSDDAYTQRLAQNELARTLESILGLAKKEHAVTHAQRLRNLVIESVSSPSFPVKPKLASVTQLRPKGVVTSLESVRAEALPKAVRRAPKPSGRRPYRPGAPSAEVEGKSVSAPKAKAPKATSKGKHTGRPPTYPQSTIERIHALEREGLSLLKIRRKLQREKIKPIPSDSHMRRIILGYARTKR